jgi:hypothetical protein
MDDAQDRDAQDAGAAPPDEPSPAEPSPDEPPSEGPGTAEEEPVAWRLTFAYQGDEVRIVDRTRVPMLSPPDETDLTEGAEDGWWVEVRDDADRPLYRQVLHEPIRHDLEVFSPEGMSHVPAPEVTGVFQAVVPDLSAAETVLLHGPTKSPGSGPGRAPDDDAAQKPPRSSRRRRTGRTVLQAPLRTEGDDDGHG